MKGPHGTEVQHNLIMHVHDTYFKAHHVQIQQNALWNFDCRSRGSDGLRKTWAMMDYKHIIHRISVWMEVMPRWYLLLLQPPKYKYKDIMRKLELPMTPFAHRAHWYFRDHTQACGTEVRHSGCVVGLYDPFGNVMVILYKLSRVRSQQEFCMCGQKVQATNTFCKA